MDQEHLLEYWAQHKQLQEATDTVAKAEAEAEAEAAAALGSSSSSSGGGGGGGGGGDDDGATDVPHCLFCLSCGPLLSLTCRCSTNPYTCKPCHAIAVVEDYND